MVNLEEQLIGIVRGFDSHLIFNELDKFDAKISVIPNGLEEYMAFFLIKT